MQMTMRIPVLAEGTLLLMLRTFGLLGLRSGFLDFLGLMEPFWGPTM